MFYISYLPNLCPPSKSLKGAKDFSQSHSGDHRLLIMPSQIAQPRGCQTGFFFFLGQYGAGTKSDLLQ